MNEKTVNFQTPSRTRTSTNNNKTTPARNLTPNQEHHIVLYLLDHKGKLSFYDYCNLHTDVFGERGGEFRRMCYEKCYSRMSFLRKSQKTLPAKAYAEKLHAMIDNNAENISNPPISRSAVATPPSTPSRKQSQTPQIPSTTLDTTTNTSSVAPALRVAGSFEQRNIAMTEPQVLDTVVLNFENKEQNPDGVFPFMDTVPFKEERKKIFHGFVAVESPFDQLETSVRATPQLDGIVVRKSVISNGLFRNKKASAKETIDKIRKEYEKTLGKKNSKELAKVVAQSHTVFFNAMETNKGSRFQERTFKLPAGMTIKRHGLGVNEDGTADLIDSCFEYLVDTTMLSQAPKCLFLFELETERREVIEPEASKSRAEKWAENIIGKY